MLKEQVVNKGQGGWSVNQGGRRRRKKEQWSDLRPLTMVRHLGFILSSVRSHGDGYCSVCLFGDVNCFSLLDI